MSTQTLHPLILVWREWRRERALRHLRRVELAGRWLDERHEEEKADHAEKRRAAIQRLADLP
jgi:hypothetical protein